MDIEEYSTLSLVRELASRSNVETLETGKKDGSSVITLKVKLDRYYGLVADIVQEKGENNIE